MRKISFIITLKNSYQDHMASLHDEIAQQMLDFFPANYRRETMLIQKDARMRLVYIPALEYNALIDTAEQEIWAAAMAIKYAKRVGMPQAIYSVTSDSSDIERLKNE